jgi:hypothetical protein
MQHTTAGKQEPKGIAHRKNEVVRIIEKHYYSKKKSNLNPARP